MDYKNNLIGLTCLSDEQHEKLFGYPPAELIVTDFVDTRKLDTPQGLPDKALPEIPALPYGDDIAEYFEQVAQNYYDRHKLDIKISSLLSVANQDLKILQAHLPELINGTKAKSWHKIGLDGKLRNIGRLDSYAMIFDCESFVKGSICNSPIVGQALGVDMHGEPAMYLWLHECWDENIPYVPTRLSVGYNKLLIGHNFAFDRQKIAETYTWEESSNVFICTMAMMQLVAGVDDNQRWALRVDPLKNYRARDIQAIGCKLGLASCYEFMTKKDLPDDVKAQRNIFVKATDFSEFREDRYNTLMYSMMDVFYNFELFQKAYPAYQEMANHKAILAGQTIVLDSVVPHIEDREDWIERCDMEYEKVEQQIYDIVFPAIKELHDAQINDPDSQLEGLNWDYVLPFRHRRDKPLPEGWDIRAKWFEPYRKGNISLKSQAIGILLQCQLLFEGEWYDVHFSKDAKFHIIYDDKIVKLPNRKDPGANYGNILSADSLYLVNRETPALRSRLISDSDFLNILRLFDVTTTYTGFKKRVVAQNHQDGLVAAEVKPAGTVSGRTVSPLYNTLPAHWDPKFPKIMSEIKMTSQCPEGWVFVGGDADSQEASIAAAMGDSFYGVSGACPFSRAVVAGNKKDGTDYHSLTAKNITGKQKVSGDERFGGKPVNFGLIYGAGVGTTGKTISLYFDVSQNEAYEKARKAVKGFKGEKEAYFDAVFGRVELPWAEYEEGIASDVFNKMVDMIQSHPPRGLFFNNQWPKALHPVHCKTDSSPPQLNYCIQASCSTYGFLSAWITAVYDEIQRNEIEARFSISIHDEIWFICPRDQAEKLAYWIMICYARTWALLHHNLYIEDMPLVRAFPSSISIDPILRKSPDAETKTPTFPHYPEGEEVTIYDLSKIFPKQSSGSGSR